MKKLMLTMILSLAMVVGLGCNSFAQYLTFSFSNVNCSPPSQVCAQADCICPSCAGGGFVGIPCCKDIPTGTTSTVNFDGSPGPCTSVFTWAPGPPDPCTTYHFTVTSGCDGTVTDSYDIVYESNDIWAGWVVVWSSGDTYGDGTPVFSFNFSPDFLTIVGTNAGGLDINGHTVQW